MPSSVCGAADGSAGLQAALRAAAGGSLWIPDGCIVNTYATSNISGNTTIACGVGATIHSTVPMSCYAAPGPLVSHGGSNITVEGFTFTGVYTPSMAAAGSAMCSAFNPAMHGGISCCDDPVIFYVGSNIVFTDNAVTNQFAGEGVLFDGSSNVTVSNNYFAYNYQEGLQIGNCKNCNVTGNYSLDSNWDLEDASIMPAGYDTGTWSNNTLACDSTGTGLAAEPAWRSFIGGTCAWNTGAGCSAAICSAGQYSNVVIQNNTITGRARSCLQSPLTAPP